jgi:UDP-glucose 4-epimerase
MRVDIHVPCPAYAYVMARAMARSVLYEGAQTNAFNFGNGCGLEMAAAFPSEVIERSRSIAGIETPLRVGRIRLREHSPLVGHSTRAWQMLGSRHRAPVRDLGTQLGSR